MIFTPKRQLTKAGLCVCFFLVFLYGPFMFSMLLVLLYFKRGNEWWINWEIFPKKKQQQQQQQQNKTKRKLTSSMTPQYTIHLYMYYFLFWPWMILMKVLSQIQILRLTCSIDFHRRHLNTIVMSATIIPPPTRLTHNVTLMFRNFQASAGNNTSCWSSSHHLRIGLLDQYDTNTEQTSFREIN